MQRREPALPLITLTTDFGPSQYPGICRAVLYHLAPEAHVLDVTHDVPPYDVVAGALIARDALPFFPPGVHMVVVDPGVGSERRGVALLTGRGDYLVGPDNGLLLPAAERLGGIAAAHELTNRELMWDPPSDTFQGYSLFAPAAAHLAMGTPLISFGPAVAPESLVRAPLPAPLLATEQAMLEATLVMWDRFGSARLYAPAAWLEQVLPSYGDEGYLESPDGRRWPLRRARTFSDVADGALAVLADSSGDVLIAVNRGSAHEQLGLDVGIRLRLARSEV